MTIVEFVVLLGVTTLCAIFGAAITGARYMGFLGLVLVGFAGVFLMRFIFARAGVADQWAVSVLGNTIPLLAAFIGATLLAVLFGLGWRRATR